MITTFTDLPARFVRGQLRVTLAMLYFFVGIVLAASAQEAPAVRPATVDEAAKVLDLRTFPLLDGADVVGERRIASLFYQAKGDVRLAYAFHKIALIERGWKELPNPYITADSASGTFGKDGFLASVSVFPGDAKTPRTVNVAVNQHGNVDLAKLPVPPDAKLTYAGPAIAMFVTETSRDRTAKACRELLTARGWEPYGDAGDSLIFKQNAVRLNAMISVAPAQGGKTAIQYSAELLSADLPAPPESLRAHYADTTTDLSFDVKSSPAALADFYRKSLGKAGWKPTTENTIKEKTHETLIFRNPRKDMLTLEFFPHEDFLRGSVRHQSVTEVAERERLADEAIAKRKMPGRPKAKAKSIVAIALPAGAADIQEKDGDLQFTVPTGNAKAAVETLRASLRQAGWKEDVAVLEALAGAVSLSRPDGGSLTLNYTDTGVMPAEVHVSGIGVEIKQAKAEAE